MRKFNPVLVGGLMTWGDWRVGGCKVLGYQSSTPVWRAYHSPGRGSGKPPTPNYFGDPLAVEVDKAMGDIDSEHKLYLYYVYALKIDGTDLARQLNTGRESVRWKIDRAHKAVADRLGYKLYK